MSTNITVPVCINARNGISNLSPLSDHPADFGQDFTRQGGNFGAKALTGYNTATATTILVPKSARQTTQQPLQVALLFNSTYLPQAIAA
jgi:hypothetical protein